MIGLFGAESAFRTQAYADLAHHKKDQKKKFNNIHKYNQEPFIALNSPNIHYTSLSCIYPVQPQTPSRVLGYFVSESLYKNAFPLSKEGLSSLSIIQFRNYPRNIRHSKKKKKKGKWGK
ncbi:hypothetical protein K469DRAFT_234579 [Zopfia rhizophila CBS 207.26]|uniref:Uncharacterized protein n=1 Tax=Zopfia rhizophila CBS 207.26 TaxID=1314779 RepID=A0A6A6ETY8_9PEZI|nr:hypothetical protein K469DRAFT_234579 [Zopfia rhizophila CBS 207.26]